MNRSLRYGTKVPPVEMTVPVSFQVILDMNRSLRYGTKVPPVEMTVHVSFYVLRFTSHVFKTLCQFAFVTFYNAYLY